MKPEVAIVQQAEATDQQLIERAQSALSQCNWVVGECASEWVQKRTADRTDEDFGAKVGMSREQIAQRRLVWERFSDVRNSYHSLSWSHFYVALNWDDAAECLQWANEFEATVAEMRAWRRSQHGEDLSEPAEEENTLAGTGDRHLPRSDSEDASVGSEIQPAGGNRHDEEDEPVAPARAEQETVSPKAGSVESAESRKAEEAAPHGLSLNDAIMTIRETCRVAQSLDPEDLRELADELRSWINVMDPQRFTAPSVGDVKEYCRLRNSPVDPEAFHSFYASKGWLIGKTKMKDWKRAIITWERKRGEEQTKSGRVTEGFDDIPVQGVYS